jgi:hypothetical protein
MTREHSVADWQFIDVRRRSSADGPAMVNDLWFARSVCADMH